MTDMTTGGRDAAGSLDTLEAIAAFLADAFDSGDPAPALAVVARADGLAQLAAAACVPREQLQGALAAGELSLDTALAIMKVIDLHLPPCGGR